MSAHGEFDHDISQAAARVQDAYDAAVKEAQAQVIESAGRVLSRAGGGDGGSVGES